MIVYKCFELHNHTIHSDGQFTPESLCQAAKEHEYDAIALTDHNTMSGIENLPPDLMKKTLPVIPGIEWTTFFGHMVVIAADKYVDWRFALPDDIDSCIEKIKAVHGVVGIAHPFRVGSPFCTGCHWDFRIKNWNLVDYVEVWEGNFPHKNFTNELCFSWWTGLLNQGFRVAAGSGRDWHNLEDQPPLTTATYLGLRDGVISPASVKEALSAGRTFVTCGPALDFSLQDSRGTYRPGDTVKSGPCRLIIKVDESRRRRVWENFNIKTENITVVHNGNVIETIPCGGSGELSCSLEIAPGWVRVEGYGHYLDETGKLLFFSSPIYIE